MVETRRARRKPPVRPSSPSGVTRPKSRRYFPGPSGRGIRISGIRADGAEVSGAQVIVTDQLELVLFGFVRAHAAIAGRLTSGAALGFGLAGPRVVEVFVAGLRMRVMPCSVLAHAFPPLPAVCEADLDYLPGTNA